MSESTIPIACPKCGESKLEIAAREKPTLEDFKAVTCAACGHVFDAKEAVTRIGIDKARELFNDMLRRVFKQGR